MSSTACGPSVPARTIRLFRRLPFRQSFAQRNARRKMRLRLKYKRAFEHEITFAVFARSPSFFPRTHPWRRLASASKKPRVIPSLRRRRGTSRRVMDYAPILRVINCAWVSSLGALRQPRDDSLRNSLDQFEPRRARGSFFPDQFPLLLKRSPPRKSNPLSRAGRGLGEGRLTKLRL